MRPAPTRAAVIAVAALPILSLPTVAHADVVADSVGVAGQTSVVADGTSIATVSYTIQNTNDSKNSAYPDPENSCNADRTSPATLRVLVPAGVTVSPASAVYTGCDVGQSFAFSASSVGEFPISVEVTDAGTGRYYTAPAAFTLTATKPAPANRAPAVSVSGVTDGSSYEFGAVPGAICSVVDAEDGSSTSAASLSAFTGARAGAGLGSRTAGCSYTDRGGLTGSAQATYSVVDTTAPAVSVPADTSREATGATTPVSFAAAATDAVDGPLDATCSPAGRSGFPVGTTTVSCSATDEAGNTGSDTFDVTVTDTTGPAVSVPPSLTARATSAAGATVTWTGITAGDLVDGPVGVGCDIDPGSVLPLGSTVVTCSAEDSRGNTGSATFSVTVQDQDAPVVTVPANTTTEATSASGAEVSYRGVSATDDVDGSVPVDCAPAPGASFPLDVTTTVTCAATDAAGNVGSSGFTVTVQDTTAPAIRVPAGPVVVEADSGLGAVATFEVSATDLVDGSVRVDCSVDSGEQFPLGRTTVSCSAADSRGNGDQRTFVVDVVDTTAPSLPRPGDLTAEATGPDGASVGYVVSDAQDAVDGPVTPVCTPASGSTFALGDTAVGCVATDRAGNEAAVSFTVRVADTTAPDVLVPANLVVEAADRDGAVGDYGVVTAGDLVDGEIAAACSPASGGVFPLGATTVECSATDEAGNTGTGSFTLTVQDTTKPLVTVPATIELEATSSAGSPATWSASASDAVDGDRDVACDPASGSTFGLGTSTVVCTASDLSGNEGRNTFDVVVRDTTAPRVSVPAPLTATATSRNGAVVQFPAATASDTVDGAVPARCVGWRSGDVFPLGTTTVTCTATDVAGNEGSATFTVTVGVSWSGVLQPVSLDGRAAFKQGSTVPVRFQLTGPSAGITDLAATLSYTRVGQGGSGGPAPAVSTSGATTGNLFRYGAGERQYLFNLNTRLMPVGTYRLAIDLGDGTPRTVTITLR